MLVDHVQGRHPHGPVERASEGLAIDGDDLTLVRLDPAEGFPPELDGGEAGGVPLEMRTLLGEAVAVLLRGRPSGDSDAYGARKAWIGIGHTDLG